MIRDRQKIEDIIRGNDKDKAIELLMPYADSVELLIEILERFRTGKITCPFIAEDKDKQIDFLDFLTRVNVAVAKVRMRW